MSLDDDVREQYPSLYFLLNDPEVGSLLRDAVNPDVGFSPATFQSKLYETSWFKGRSASAREWEILQHTDPGEAALRMENQWRGMDSQYSKLGVAFDPNETYYIQQASLQRGHEIGSREANQGLADYLHQRHDKVQIGGQISGIATQTTNVAREEYLINWSNDEATDWGISLALGEGSEEGLRQVMMFRAASAYPHLTDRLYAGETMGNIVAPYKSLIAEELELPENTINMMDSRWRTMYDFTIQGNRRTMTMSEASIFVRSQPEHWVTAKGKSEGAQMGQFLSRTFGMSA